MRGFLLSFIYEGDIMSLQCYIRRRKSLGKIVAFTNQKGGVGKTTTCVNLAAYLCAFSKKVLIVDLDPQGNATTGVGIDKSKDLKTLYNIIDNDCSAAEAVLGTNLVGLDIIPSTVDLAGAEIDLVQIKSREKVLKRALDSLKNSYDYVLIDCPPSLGLLTVNALTASNSIMIPIQCEFYALEGLSQLMNTIKLVKQHLNPEIEIEGVILTMKDSRSNLVNQVAAEIQKFFGKKVFEVIIPRNIRLAEAPSHGLPIVIYDNKAPGAIAYQELTREFLKRNNDKGTVVPKEKLFKGAN